MTTKVLGFDFGTKRIGIAFGQSITATASPITTVTAKNGTPNWHDIDTLIQTWQPDQLIVGLPLNMDGTEQTVTIQAKAFGKQLQQRYQLPLEFVDERLTSQAAKWEIVEKQDKKKDLKRIDTYAACLIVESWLSSH